MNLTPPPPSSSSPPVNMSMSRLRQPSNSYMFVFLVLMSLVLMNLFAREQSVFQQGFLITARGVTAVYTNKTVTTSSSSLRNKDKLNQQNKVDIVAQTEATQAKAEATEAEATTEADIGSTATTTSKKIEEPPKAVPARKAEDEAKADPEPQPEASPAETQVKTEAELSRQPEVKAELDSAALVGENTTVPNNHDTPTFGSKTVFNVTLVTNFWASAVRANSKGNPNNHTNEIPAAILHNLQNPYIHQMVVILDSAPIKDICQQFSHKMQKMQQRFVQWKHEQQQQQHANLTVVPPSSSSHDISKEQIAAKLRCITRKESQPSYYEMFQYATDPNLVTGDVVILANPDQAFDDTVQWAQHLHYSSVLTLPTWGYEVKKAPQSVSEVFSYVRHDTTVDKFHVPRRCNGRFSSWDGYVFHRTFVRGRLRPDDFMRNTDIVKENITIVSSSDNNNTTTASNVTYVRDYFKMNDGGGENAALWALLHNLPNETYATDGCNAIQTWHIHAAPKMHATSKQKAHLWGGKDPMRVPMPYGEVPKDTHYSNAFFIQSLADANEPVQQ
ncbi:expressed unknown protein [Seminavis robusta]|uniref:Uncharacterized protein n=1 Tax=Seminavis robusta TaxID=568900 RepID=A0A9N8DW67_9STRA|nr:expressed unknown protein [Seminavis robusta]|eukprot:Sro420_g139350.1 n/a (559) ;mRNA; r:42099-43775